MTNREMATKMIGMLNELNEMCGRAMGSDFISTQAAGLHVIRAIEALGFEIDVDIIEDRNGNFAWA